MKYAINAVGVPTPMGPYSQTTRIIHLAQSILAEAGCTLSDVAQTTIYLTDINDLPKVNEIYRQYFVLPAPSRAVVEISALPLGALIEMNCIACR